MTQNVGWKSKSNTNSSRHASKLQETLSSLEVRILIGLRLGRESSIGGPEVDQRLHRLQLMRLQQVQGRSSEDEVAEAAVKVVLEVQVIERLCKVRPVQMRVNTEHLEEDGLANAEELLWETAPLANPFIRSSEQSVGGDLGVVGETDPRCVGRENGLVVNLA